MCYAILNVLNVFHWYSGFVISLLNKVFGLAYGSSYKKCSLYKVFLKILQNSQESTCVGVLPNKVYQKRGNKIKVKIKEL